MKTILVDAVNTFVIKDFGVFNEMYKMLEKYQNRKIILTNANDEQIKLFGLDNLPYELFTLKHNPEKTDNKYYRKVLEYFNLNAKDVVYFEHNMEAVKSAQSLGIITYHYNKDKKDLISLEKFIKENI
ncbi:MAG TPA: hypothetical protein PK142_02725 [bacterium]|nr:hypothetical protein [bacterium]